MSDRGDPVIPSTPVHIVPAPAPRGISQNGLLQSLQREGISRGVIDESRATQITEFISVFDKSDVLKPIARRTTSVSDSLAVAGNDLLVEILAPRDRILVIRSLVWEVEIGGLPPNGVQVRFSGRQDEFVGSTFPFLIDNGPFPISNRVIGDVASPLSALFYQFLPIALLPGDRLIFVQTASPPAILGSRVIWFEETHLAPFRPAGL